MPRDRDRQSGGLINYKPLSNTINLFDNNDNVQLDGYQYGAQSVQKQLPLPSHSVKIPYKQHPNRFVLLNQKNRELQYLRGQVQRKCELEELHYQANIERMKQQNFMHRQMLQKLLIEDIKNPAMFDQHRMYNLDRPRLGTTKHHYTQQKPNSKDVSFYSQERVLSKEEKLEQLLKQKQNLLDQIDRVKIEGVEPVKLTNRIQRNSDTSSDSDENKGIRKEKMDQRKSELDYIYKRNKDVKDMNNHFERKMLKEQVLQSDEKRKEYEWVRKVRKARKNKFEVKEESSDNDSSSSSHSSIQKKMPTILQRQDPPQNKKIQKPIIQTNSGNTTKNVLQTYRRSEIPSRYEPLKRNQPQPIQEVQSRQEQSDRLSRPARIGGDRSRKIHYIHPKLAKQQREPSYIDMYEADQGNRSKRYDRRSSYNHDSSRR